jgi:steroid delta-isomerase
MIHAPSGQSKGAVRVADRNQIIAAIETHCRALTDRNKEAWLGIWAEDAVLEDPVGFDAYRGLESLSRVF